ncbi:reverse transcriptase domain-containing protein [Lacticaseibacillus paracasei]|uniref:reverse transcriptase domain-containing protein n=1 Tax=Lacticaseibacillus paracasei TaxID=1597 RepID=UPI000FF3623E|nr:reverse transcriptase domain-containing protein [Lacticaseibacillus paracasei]RNE34196.1 Retron-type reverse transcriptase [Lacticaseibacillus paracasei]
MKHFEYHRQKKISDFHSRDSFIHELHIVSWITDERKQLFSRLLNSPGNFYKEFSIPKKYGEGERIIDAPNEDLKSLQIIIKSLIENQLKVKEFVFGKYDQAYQKNKGIFTNAQIHRNKKYLVHIDLEGFFPSIHFGRVSGFFQKSRLFKLEPPMAFFFANLCCYKGHLPQGAPTSPLIANLIGEKLDREVLLLSKKFRFTYSRYADDLTFSTNNVKSITNDFRSFMDALNYMIEKMGFNINWDKVGIEGPDVRHTVTGLSNNKRVSSTVDFYKLTRAMANSLYVDNEFFDAKRSYNAYTQKSLEKAIQVIEGRYAFINDIEDKNKKLYERHSGGEEYQSITPTDFREHHYISSRLNGVSKENLPAIYSGKKLSYSRFLFYKKFLAGDAMTVFTEGKTDPMYISAAMKALTPNLKITFTIPQVEGENQTQFANLFDLNRGGASLRRILDIYFGISTGGHASISHPLYFEKKIISIKPCVLLLDFEFNDGQQKSEKANSKKKNSSSPHPLVVVLNYIFQNRRISKKKAIIIKDDLIKNGFYFVDENLYIATTTDRSGDKTNRAIEDYFPASFLNDPYGDGTKHFENAPMLKKDNGFKDSDSLRKYDFAKYVKTQTETVDLFKDFNILFDIFNNIRKDYNRRLLKKIADVSTNYTILAKNTMYRILDSDILRKEIADDSDLNQLFFDNYKKLFDVSSY